MKAIKFKWIVFGLLGFASVAAESPPAQQPAAAPQASQTQPDFAVSRSLLRRGKYDEAISQLQAIAATNPLLKGLDSELGTAYYQKGDYIKAIESLKKALVEDRENKEAIQLLGLSYYLSGRPGEAILPLEKVQGWYLRANVDASYILGLCYIQTKDYPQARKAFARMFEVPADSAASYLFTARMLLRQEFDPIAEEYAQKAIPNCRWLIFFWESSTFTNPASLRPLATSSRNWRSTPAMRRRITSWLTPTLASRNSMTQKDSCSAPFGWMPPQPGLTS